MEPTDQPNPIQKMPPETSQQPDRENNTSPKQTISTGAILARVAGILLVIFGIAIGFYAGFIVSFGSCYKSSCSPLESGAPIWLAIVSLFITIPIARVLFKTSK